MRFSHTVLDASNELQDHLLAQRLRRDLRLLRLAQANLRRWKARDGKRPRPVFLEWHRILDYLSPSEIADFLASDTPMARRLRQSSPFMGLFPKLRRSAREKIVFASTVPGLKRDNQSPAGANTHTSIHFRRHTQTNPR